MESNKKYIKQFSQELYVELVKFVKEENPWILNEAAFRRDYSENEMKERIAIRRKGFYIFIAFCFRNGVLTKVVSMEILSIMFNMNILDNYKNVSGETVFNLDMDKDKLMETFTPQKLLNIYEFIKRVGYFFDGLELN